MQFDPFVIPFNIGLYFILFYVVARSVIWFRELSRADKLRLQRGFFGIAFALSLKEIFMESLLHRKILKTNFRLGYMHMSLAFGWFLLILFGEDRIYAAPRELWRHKLQESVLLQQDYTRVLL